MAPILIGWPGVFAICTVDSVWPKPSRMVWPQARWTWSITSALSGSPADTTLVGGFFSSVRSAWISIRQTVGGAQKLVTDSRSICSMSALASKRS